MSLARCPWCPESTLILVEVDVGRFTYHCTGCLAIGPHADGDDRPADARWNDRPRDGARTSDVVEEITAPEVAR